MAAVNLVTGAYPTLAPSNAALTGKTLARTASTHRDVDVKVIVSAASGVGSLIAWDGTHWCPIGDLTLDNTLYGGVAFGRFTPGNGFTHYAIWEKTAGATVTSAALVTNNLR